MSGSKSLRRRRDDLIGIVMLAALLIPVATLAASQVATVLPPERFTRTAGAPDVTVRQFSVAPPVEGPFTLTISSGEPDTTRPAGIKNAARGTVRLNGVEIVTPRDFAGGSRLERTVALEATNVLEVRVLGAPGAYLTLGITGVVQLQISSLTPDNGPVETAVLISGSGFDPVAENNQVAFNGTLAAVLSATTTAIQTIVPAGATTGPITVTTPHGTAASTPFTVTSGNRLLISKSPDQPIYSRGQPVTVSALVVDRNGQAVPGAEVTLTSTPAEDARAGTTFVYQSDGTFTIAATADVAGETLTASLAVTVAGQGPAIACTQPFDGAMVTGAPGSLLLHGTVNSTHGITAFTVNGADVAVVDGSFAAAIGTAWGLNVVNLSVVDNNGTTARQTCSFVLSTTWASEEQFIADTVSLKMTQPAFDDFNRGNAIGSFADLLFAAVNAGPVRDALDAALAAANPLKPMSCDQFISFLGANVCVMSSEVRYLSSQLPGPNTTSLTLVNGGLASVTRFDNPVVRLRVRGDVASVAYDVTGDVIFDYVEIHATFDTVMVGGRPRSSVRPGSVSVQVGNVVTNFPGLDVWLVDNVVVPLAQGWLRSNVANLLSHSVVNSFTSILDGVIGGLEVAVPANYLVPKLSPAPSLTMSAGIGFSSLSTTSSRMLFGIATRFETAATHARPSLGAPIRPGAIILEPTVTSPRTVGAAFHEVTRGQALHALWRGGYFDGIFTGGALNGTVPANVSVATVAGLPPVTRIRDDARVEFAIGAMRIELQHPALVPNPMVGNLAGRVSCATALQGDQLVFENCLVDDLQFAAATPVDAATLIEVEALLAGVLREMLTAAARDALPVLPIPRFVLPPSLGTYGLPADGVFGIVSPQLGSVQRHFTLLGGMGIR